MVSSIDSTAIVYREDTNRGLLAVRGNEANYRLTIVLSPTILCHMEIRHILIYTKRNKQLKTTYFEQLRTLHVKTPGYRLAMSELIRFLTANEEQFRR